MLAPALAPRPSAAAIKRARQALVSALGGEKVIDDPDLFSPYSEDYSFGGTFPPDLVVRAASAEDVQAVFRIATEEKIPVTPRGLGSGKSGGALPICGGIVLSLEKMNGFRELDRDSMFAVTEPGIVTRDFMDIVEADGLFYPPDPNSRKICSLGGNVACNAGGPRALKYGVTRAYILGLEVVLPTGEKLNIGRKTIKGVTGYDLVGMFVGSEGTLGVITEITTKLVPRPTAVETALVSFKSLEEASVAITAVLGAGIVPRTLEFLDHPALSAVRAKTPGRFPDDAEALLILETDGSTEDHAMAELARAAEICTEQGAVEVLVAQDEAQREKMWEPRRVLSITLSESAPRKISEDIVVPRGRIPTMLSRARTIGERHKIRLATYGHAGDGNLHVNFLFDEASRSRAEAAVRDVMETTIELGGTISGEHGVGLTKREFISLEQDREVIDLQKRLKAVFDPAQILNPGKIFPSRSVRE